MRRVGATPMMVGVEGNGEVMVIEGGVHRFRVNSSTVKIVLFGSEYIDLTISQMLVSTKLSEISKIREHLGQLGACLRRLGRVLKSAKYF